MVLHGSGGCVSSKLGVHVYLIDRHEIGGRGISFFCSCWSLKEVYGGWIGMGRCEVGFRIIDDDADDEEGWNW